MTSTESRRDLNRVMDWTRALGLCVLGIDQYLVGDITVWFWTYFPGIEPWLDMALERFRILGGRGSPWLRHLALGFGLISVWGQPGSKTPGSGLHRLVMILILFFSGLFLLYGPSGIFPHPWASWFRVGGYLLILTGGWRISRFVSQPSWDKDLFNRDQASFPQEERKRNTPYSLNFPARYRFHGRSKKSWINIINPFRGMLIMGSPGAGKSYFLIRELIRQHIRKGFTMFIYDFKYDDLTRIAYYHWQKHRQREGLNSSFHQLAFEDLSVSERCNPLDPDSLMEISDAAESARTLLLGLNRTWVRKQGDFFVESSIQLLTGAIWYLRSQAKGRYCTLPHLLEFIQQPYPRLFTLMRCQSDLQSLMTPFVQAYIAGAVDQLEGQVASLRISLARLHSPSLYYLLSGDDFNLDLNDPQAPKIICLGNYPPKAQVYGAVASLFIGRLLRLVNQKHKLPSSLIFDELPTVYVPGIDTLMATARSNRVSTCLAIQDMSQLIRDYGREQAQVILQVSGNLICGQVSGETAKGISERIGKVFQRRYGQTVHDSSTSWNQSSQLDTAIPVSTLSQLSSGEFVGLVSDNPDQPIEQKVFHAHIRPSSRARKEEDRFDLPFPKQRGYSEEEVERVYQQVKEDMHQWVESEIERIEDTPELQHLVVRPPRGRGGGEAGD